MKLATDKELETSPVVANCRMNRERNLQGTNGYDRDLRFDPLEFLRGVVAERGTAKWLDLCCGTGKALVEAAAVLDAEQLPATIVGVDLVGMFDESRSRRLKLVEASLTDWQPTEKFDLITCVHGMHYIGDKLGLVSRCATWLTGQGHFVANLDMKNMKLKDDEGSRVVVAELRRNGVEYSPREKLLTCRGRRESQFSFRYLGADDQAGPNYTGQPAVTSHYQR